MQKRENNLNNRATTVNGRRDHNGNGDIGRKILAARLKSEEETRQFSRLSPTNKILTVKKKFGIKLPVVRQ